MRRGGALRQIILVALTAIAAVMAGQALRQAADSANAPTAAPSVVDATPSSTP